jgi:hypothetical protein
MKMPVSLYAALVCASTLAGCGDGSDAPASTSAQSTESTLADTRPATNDSLSVASSGDTRDASTASNALNASNAVPSLDTLAASAAAPGDSPSAPVAMSPGVIASIDPPSITRPSRIPLTSVTSTDTDDEAQVQPVVHYPPDSADGS